MMWLFAKLIGKPLTHEAGQWVKMQGVAGYPEVEEGDSGGARPVAERGSGVGGGHAAGGQSGGSDRADVRGRGRGWAWDWRGCWWFWGSCGFSAGFGLVVWRLRSATGPAAAMGAVICLGILLGRVGRAGVPSAGWRDTGLPALLALFVLTFAATRFGRSRKEAMGTAEARTGRRAAQVVANLGVAGLCAGRGPRDSVLMAACVAALAEATADTMSSEMGQVFAGSRWGRTLLITTGRPGAAGTEGGLRGAGTLFGVAGALVTVLMSPVWPRRGGRCCWRWCAGAGCAGLVFDSVLGATVERRGWLGNDLVNFTSTVFAAAAGVWWWRRVTQKRAYPAEGPVLLLGLDAWAEARAYSQRQS